MVIQEKVISNCELSKKMQVNMIFLVPVFQMGNGMLDLKVTIYWVQNI